MTPDLTTFVTILAIDMRLTTLLKSYRETGATYYRFAMERYALKRQRLSEDDVSCAGVVQDGRLILWSEMNEQSKRYEASVYAIAQEATLEP